MSSVTTPRNRELILALDTASPRISLALGRAGKVLLEKDFAQSSASEHLLSGVSTALRELGEAPRALGGVVALAGPGSFTGLRVGLATALGLHQALGLPGLGVPTFEALAEVASAVAKHESIVAVVDALRGEWFTQAFARSAGAWRPTGEPRLLDREGLGSLAPCLIVGFGIEKALGGEGALPGLGLFEPSTLAGATLAVAARWPGGWNAASLVEPMYLRPPAVTMPGKRSA